MTREIREKDFKQQWKRIKQDFENCQKKIRNYDNRPLDDDDRKDKYKNEIVEEYNKIITFIAECIEEFTRDAQKQLLEKIDNLENILINRLQTLGFRLQLPEDRLDVVDIELITKEVNARGSLNDSELFDDASEEVDESLDFEDDQLDQNEVNCTSLSKNKIEEIAGSSTAEDSKVVKSVEKQLIDNHLQNKLKMAPPDADVFMTTCSRHINKHFSGDPLERTAFIKSIKLLKNIGVNDENKKLLASYVQTRLTGKASEWVTEECEDIDEIIKAIEDNCKAENSKVVAGRLMALRADRANLTDFAKRAEQLCEAYQRSLVLEGTSRAKATELTVDKTIDLCKANTASTVVLSMLASYKFEDANEVIAKYTIETRNAVADKQTLHFRSNNRGRANFNKNRNFRNNFHNNNFHNNNNFQARNQSYSNNNGWNGNTQNYRNGNRQSRGNSRGNFNRRENRVNAFNAQGNDNSPPPGENVIQLNRADRN